MNLPFNIARRYIFGKKSTSAINYITMISMSGIAVGTTALLLVLSVFNGLEDLIQDLYSSFQPDIMVTPKEGKVFEVDSATYTRLTAMEDVKYVAKSLEETAFFEYEGSQGFGMIKGVDDEWLEVSRLDSVIHEGEYKLKGGRRDFAVVGYGIRNNLGISVEDYLSEMTVYMLKNKTVGNFEKPFKKQYLQPAGIFVIQQQFDEKYVITNLAFAQKLRGYKKGEISQLEIKLTEKADGAIVKEKILDILGDNFEIKNRYEQNSAFFKLMKVEKWMAFAITLLVMMMVAINMIGCMLMLVHEKKKDIAILKSMGADNSFIHNVFLGVGVWMTGIGLVVGFVLGLLIYWLHKIFNLVPMEGFIVDAYPASMRFWDFIVIIIFVLAFGILSSIYPAYFAARIKSLVRND